MLDWLIDGLAELLGIGFVLILAFVAIKTFAEHFKGLSSEQINKELTGWLVAMIAGGGAFFVLCLLV